MGSAKKENKPAKYIIRIKNHLDPHWERWFEGMTITHVDDGVTILSGDVVDQSALHGLFEKIHILNLSIISFKEVDPGDREEGDSEHENG